MKNSAKLLGVAALATVAVSAGPAVAAEAEGTLTCGADTFPISGFGRGQVFHVVGSTTQFVVTKAQVETADGPRTVFDNPGQAGRADVVTCTTTSPAPRNTPYVFSGFFTPRA